MSFILEALTQSEEERQRGEVPSFSSSPSTSVEAPAMAPRWPYVLSVALLLNLVVAAAWLMIEGAGQAPAVVARAATPDAASVVEKTGGPQPAQAEKTAEPGAGPSRPPAVNARIIEFASAMTLTCDAMESIVDPAT